MVPSPQGLSSLSSWWQSKAKQHSRNTTTNFTSPFGLTLLSQKKAKTDLYHDDRHTDMPALPLHCPVLPHPPVDTHSMSQGSHEAKGILIVSVLGEVAACPSRKTCSPGKPWHLCEGPPLRPLYMTGIAYLLRTAAGDAFLFQTRRDG